MMDPQFLADLNDMGTRDDASRSAWLAFSDQMGDGDPLTGKVLEIAAACFRAGFKSAIVEISQRQMRRLDEVLDR